MKIKTIKSKGKIYIQIPNEFSIFDYIELFRLKEGFYLLSIPLSKEKSLSKDERDLLEKLISMKYQERAVPEIKKHLTKQEKEILSRLLTKNYVFIYYNKKFPNGVYNIDENIFKSIKSLKRQTKAKDHFLELINKGFTILENQKKAEQLSYKIKKEKKEKSIVGIKGFDGKYYVFLKQTYYKYLRLIKECLKSQSSLEKIANKLKLDKDLVKGILTILCESGEVIEKHPGEYEFIQN